MKKASVLLVAIALAIFGLAACGGDDDDEGDGDTEAATVATEAEKPAGGAGGTIELSSPADGSFAYDQESVTTKAGTVTVNYSNPSSLSHDVVIEDESGQEVGKTELVSQGDTSATVRLQPGTYTYYCDVSGHREGGMEGTLTVN